MSSDNLYWTRLSESPSVLFNTGFDRYEITFPVQETRYIKTVNSGTNDIVTVLVTEIEALEEAPETERIEKSQEVHTFDIGGTYRFSERLHSNADLTYKYEPKGDFRDSKDQLYYTISARHMPRTYLSQFVRFQAGFDHYKSSGIEDKTRKISYSLLARPLKSADFSFSVSSQQDYQDDSRTLEIRNAILEANGNILRGLDIQGEVGFSRINRFDSGKEYNSWTYRLSSASSITRSLDLNASFLYQSTRDNVFFQPRRRRQLSLNSNYRATGAILLQASYYVNDDNGIYNITQDYDLNWNIGRNLTIGGSADLIKNSDNARIGRYNGRVNVRLGVKTAIFANYTRQIYSPSGILNNSSIQIGLKSGF